jgi:hypothetical protein
MDDYPFFFDQPWPFVMSMIGFAGAAIAAFSSWRAWRTVRMLTRVNNTLRIVLMMKDTQHELEVRSLIERFGGELDDDDKKHTIQ